MATNVGRKERIALLLAAGWSARRVARKFVIHARTITRWRKSAEFNRMVDEFRRSMSDRALGRLCAAVSPAAAELRRLARSKDERVRLAACRVILEQQTKRDEQQTILERLVVLVQAMANSPTPVAGVNGRAAVH
jgi:hypothetical protein